MIYRLFLIINFLLFAAPCIAGEKRYRVEILVLTHIQHEAIPSEAGQLRDFSASLDFLKTEDDDENETEGAEATGDEEIGAEQLIFNEPVGAQPGEADTEQGEDPGGEILPDDRRSIGGYQNSQGEHGRNAGCHERP